MSDFDPDAFLAKTSKGGEPKASAPFDPDAFLARDAKPSISEPGTPFELALAEQSGDIVTVETPTGPAKFTRSGVPFYGAAEAGQMQATGAARLKERALEGGLSFFSGGGPFADELMGAGAALNPKLRGSEILPAYRRGRDSARQDIAGATRNASPTVNVGDVSVPVLPALGAAVPSLMAPLPLGWLGRIASAGFQGAEAGAGGSTADLTQGGGDAFLRDVGTSTGIGFLAGGVAEGLAAPMRALGRVTSQEAGAARQAVLSAEQVAADKAAGSSRGALGGVTAGINHDVQWAERVLANPSAYLPEETAAAQSLWNHPEAVRLRIQNAGNTLNRFGSGTAREQAARTALADATAAADPAAVAGRVAAKTAPGAIVEDVGSKLMRSVGQRMALGAAGSGLGAGAAWIAGEDPKWGAAFGGAAGGASPGVLQFARNQASSPVVQHGVNSLVSRLLRDGAGTTGKAASLISPVGQSARPADPLEKERTAIQAFLRGN